MSGYIASVLQGAPRGSMVLRYGGAIVATAIAVLLGVWLQQLVDPPVPLLIGVLVAAWFSGLWPALLAALLSTVALDYFFTPPLYTLSLKLTHIPHFIAFAIIGVVFATASAARRNAERSLKQARDELDAKVRERTADLEQLAGRLINAQEEERSRIGRELHDHISQMLGVLTIRLDQLRADHATPPLLAEALTELRHSTESITDDVHSLSHRLHSSALDYLGVVPAVQRLVSEFSTRHGIAIEFRHTSVPPALASDVGLCLFRVIEESLTNVAKHSHATSGRVRLFGGPDGIHLVIEDTGDGFDTATLGRRAGLGFVSMRERLRVVRGTLHVDSTPGRGTTIDVRVPAASLVAAPPDAHDSATSAQNATADVGSA